MMVDVNVVRVVVEEDGNVPYVKNQLLILYQEHQEELVVLVEEDKVIINPDKMVSVEQQEHQEVVQLMVDLVEMEKLVEMVVTGHR
jgi:hypothetical protein